MTNKEINRFRQKLREILLIEVSPSQREKYLKSLEDKFHKLLSLAQDVGASCYLGAESLINITKILEESPHPEGMTSAIESAICRFVYHINDALRVEAVINATKAASRSCWISIIAAIAAIAAAVASWVIALGAN